MSEQNIISVKRAVEIAHESMKGKPSFGDQVEKSLFQCKTKDQKGWDKFIEEYSLLEAIYRFARENPEELRALVEKYYV